MKLDQAFLDAVAGPIESTWAYIASDALQLGRVSQAGAFELVLDANRMASIGQHGIAADKMVGEAIKEHGYAKVVAFLKRRIKLAVS